MTPYTGAVTAERDQWGKTEKADGWDLVTDCIRTAEKDARTASVWRQAPGSGGGASKSRRREAGVGPGRESSPGLAELEGECADGQTF